MYSPQRFTVALVVALASGQAGAHLVKAGRVIEGFLAVGLAWVLLHFILPIR